MQEPYIGEIRMFAGHYAPRGWAFCNGQLLSVRDNTPLFSVLGTRYGGDGRSNFALPDLRGRTPLHPDPNVGGMALAMKGGEASLKLMTEHLPTHGHQARCVVLKGTTSTPTGAVWARNTAVSFYSTENPDTAMNPNALEAAGKGEPHNNRQPFLGLHFVIALVGVYPSRG